MTAAAVVRDRFISIILLAAVLLGGSLPFAQADVARGFSEGAELRLGEHELNSPGDWKYTIRPDDTLKEVADRLLRANRTAGDLITYNGLGTKDSFSTGDAINIPMSWLQRRPEPAVVRSVVGDAFFRPHLESRNQRLNAGQELGIGDEVRTHSGQVVIELADGSRLELDQHTRLTFNRLTQFGKTGMADTRMFLERGRIQSRVVPIEDEQSRFEVETPSAVAAVRGTQFGLEVEDDRTRLEVWEGNVLFGTAQHHELVPAGHGAIQGATGGPSIETLPPAPVLTQAQTEVSALPASIAWEDDSGAAQYQVDLYHQETDEWLFSRTLSDPELNLHQLDNGEHQLRLAAIGPDRMQGNPQTLDFVVDLRAYPAVLEAPDMDQTLDETRPEFRWSLEGEEEQARVEVASDRDFEELVASSDWREEEKAVLAKPLPGGHYYWRVVTRAGGTSEAHSATGSFSVRGSLPHTRIINVNTVGDQVNLYWNSLDEADLYKLQLARDEQFEDLVQSLEVPDTNARLQLRAGETYHIRVRGVAEPPMTSDWGATREVTLE